MYCSNFSVKCEASNNNIVEVDFFIQYGARRDCNNVETVQVKKKKKQYVGFLRFWLIMKI